MLTCLCSYLFFGSKISAYSVVKASSRIYRVFRKMLHDGMLIIFGFSVNNNLFLISRSKRCIKIKHLGTFKCVHSHIHCNLPGHVQTASSEAAIFRKLPGSPALTTYNVHATIFTVDLKCGQRANMNLCLTHIWWGFSAVIKLGLWLWPGSFHTPKTVHELRSETRSICLSFCLLITIFCVSFLPSILTALVCVGNSSAKDFAVTVLVELPP